MIHRQAVRRILGRTLAFAAVATVIVALRVLERGESFQPRTLLLLAMVAGGAFPAGAAVFALAEAVAERWPPLLRGVLAAPLLAIGIGGCTALIFALLRPITKSDFDHDDHHLFDAIGMLGDAVGLFVITGERYWLPWPAPAITLAGGILAALPWRVAGKIAPAPENALVVAR